MFAYTIHFADDPVTAVATKYCEANGTWYTHPVHGVEMSDYLQCVDSQVRRTLRDVCNAALNVTFQLADLPYG